MKVLNAITWFSFLVCFVISFLTIFVTFGLLKINEFMNFMPLEISLSITLFLWGIDNLFVKYTKSTVKTLVLSFILGSILLIFLTFKVY